MPFYRIGDPGQDGIAHLNYGSKAGPAQCKMPKFEKDDGHFGYLCGRSSVALCDSKGCDIPICELHRTKHATKPNTDFCTDHKDQACEPPSQS